MAAKVSRPVYSTGPSGALPAGYRACKRCGHWPCRCEPQASIPPGDQAPRVRRETAGRAGKTVTTITPLLLRREDAQGLLGELKKLCGGGGTLKVGNGSDGRPVFVIELQGDHAERIVTELTARGYRAKRAGVQSAAR